MNRAGGIGRALRLAVLVVAAVAAFGALRTLDREESAAGSDERLYFPSGRFLVESSLGFRSEMADWLWFRFIQYYGAYKKGLNDLRYLDLLVESVTRLDPAFVEAYHLASLINWSDFGRLDESYDILRKGILANPDNASLRFQVGFMHYVTDRDYRLAAHWFEMATRCSDAGPREFRFAAFARYRAGDDRVSLALWEDLKQHGKTPQTRDLADRMIKKLQHKLAVRASYGPDFVGPIPEER